MIFLSHLEKWLGEQKNIDICIYKVYTKFRGGFMDAKIQKWGNSLGIRLPMNILKGMDLKQNDIVDVSNEDNKLIIIKKEKVKISLKDRIEKYKGPNLSKEFSWDEPVGKEIW